MPSALERRGATGHAKRTNQHTGLEKVQGYSGRKFKGRDTLCDKSLRHFATTSRLVCTAAATGLLAPILSLRYVARIQTSLNSCDRWQRQNSVAATMIFTCHTRRFVAATCRSDVSLPFNYCQCTRYMSNVEVRVLFFQSVPL